MFEFSILDYVKNGQTVFVTFQVRDVAQSTTHKGMVRIVGNIPYGDIIHPKKTTLSEACRQFVYESLEKKIKAHTFE